MRIGWYGGGPKKKEACDCNKLVEHMLKKANARVKFDEFLSGTIEGGLEVNKNKEGEECDLKTAVDFMGRVTQLMGRYTQEDPFQELSVLNDVGVHGDSDEMHPDEIGEEEGAEESGEVTLEEAAPEVVATVQGDGPTMRSRRPEAVARTRALLCAALGIAY